MAIERDFDVSFIARLTAEEKQIQQNYRPVIGVHKWFARRPGAMFRGLLLAEFTSETLSTAFFKGHKLEGVTVADPFMGGGTTLFEANRAGCNVVGFDINPMAFWIVRQELIHVDRKAMRRASEEVIADVQREIGTLYTTSCLKCGKSANVKYFLWVKQQICGGCQAVIDLFPGYSIAGTARHTHHVLHCPCCKQLIEVEELRDMVSCPKCSESFDWRVGNAKRNQYTCLHCKHQGRYPAELSEQGPPRHRLFGIEYHCERCYSSHKGRLYKTPDKGDLARLKQAVLRLAQANLAIPEDAIADGDETKRLHRWGYRKFREMFNTRQLLSLGILMRRILQIEDVEARHALATVFSDSLRYQNMLCRYDEYALKCQDIFAVHGFPVGLIQCENNVIGIPKVGGGGFRHFIEKYDRAKEYCERPFETVRNGKGRKLLTYIEGERIEAELVKNPKDLKGQRKALLRAGSIEDLSFPEGSFDAVFTDPPYFDNVQYAELMDFCYSWLRVLLNAEFKQFTENNTRSLRELTGNNTTGKDLAHFTEGLSLVFSCAARALKLGGPFVFTYHHNDIEAYVPIVVAILDAGLFCTATLPCPAEMTASLHINGTGSSVMDTIVVCRKTAENGKMLRFSSAVLRRWLECDREKLAGGGITATRGDLYCLSLGHLARVAISMLHGTWNRSLQIQQKIIQAESLLRALVDKHRIDTLIEEVLVVAPGHGKASQLSLFD